MPDISSKNVVSTYRFYAPLYDLLFGAVLGPGRKRMARTVHQLEPVRILEIGIGTGLTLDQYPRDAIITGIDLSPEMLDRARKRAVEMQGRAIDLHVMDAEALDFADASFDCVTAPYVLSVTPDPDRLVSELRRVCRPGGHIVIVNHFSGSRFWWLLEQIVRPVADRIGFRSDFDYSRHILSHNWQVESCIPVNLFGLSKLVVIRNA
jgi:phosphatidylethanolamine/phosphatidyl-N-methylethanolamine N-methyltransferase